MSQYSIVTIMYNYMKCSYVRIESDEHALNNNIGT